MSSQAAGLVADAVAKLPEIYQPIYGHPELSHGALRSCDDRLAYLFRLHDAFSEKLGRPLRILDLGCAQGYMSLQLAARGATVTGIDIVPANIAICKALAAEHSELALTFLNDPAEVIIDLLQPDTYDLALGLSVFQHLVYTYGANNVYPLMQQLAQRVPVCVFETALASEPAVWAASQPDDENALLGEFAFTIELARVVNNLSNQTRPLLFASSRYWYVNGQIEAFDTWSAESQRFVGPMFRGSRRYFQNANHVLKLFSTMGTLGPINLLEVQSEADFLQTQSDVFENLPALTATGRTGNAIWLLRERIEGMILLDAVLKRTWYDPARVIKDVLTQLAALEERGLYHSDIRTWNVLLKPDGSALLIDYGAIVPLARAGEWPENIFFAFWLFACAAANRSAHPGTPQLAIMLSPTHLPEHLQNWAYRFWNTQPANWSFRKILEDFEAAVGKKSEKTEPSPLGLWMHEVETYLCRINDQQRELQAAIAKLTPPA